MSILVIPPYKWVWREQSSFYIYIETHNFIVKHIKDNKVGFWGRRKLRHALKHLSEYNPKVMERIIKEHYE